MNIVFNKFVFAYLCLFYNSIKYFHEFQSIFVNFCFTDIFVEISIDIYRYFRYIRKIQVSIYPQLPIFCSLRLASTKKATPSRSGRIIPSISVGTATVIDIFDFLFTHDFDGISPKIPTFLYTKSPQNQS